MLFRRVISIVLMLSVLLLSVAFLPGSQVLALTTTPLPPSQTPTRTPTPACVAPSYFVRVTPSVASVNIGDQIVVSVYTNVGIASFSLYVTDNATGLTQSQTDPILTPSAPATQIPPGGTSTVQWTLTAVRAGSVTLRGSVYGEVQACSGGGTIWTYGGASGVSGIVAVGIHPTTTPVVAGDLGYGTVSGRVTDATTGAAISGAVVTCSHSAYNPISPCTGTRTTAADGSYSFANVFFHDTDRITVSVAANGYVSQTFVKTAFTSAGLTANFALVAATGALPDLQVLSITEYSYTPPTATPNAQGCWPASYPALGLRVTIQNVGTGDAGPFVLDLNGVQPTVNGLAAGQTLAVDFQVGLTRSRIATVDATGLVAESDETNNTYSLILSAATSTRTGTPRPTLCITRTITATPTVTVTPTISRTPTITLTTPVGTCSPVSATITAPFTYDGVGTFCWQSSNLGGYANSWNLASLTINGVNFTNTYVASGSYPAKVGGYWYVRYIGNYPWSHFEAK